MPSSRALSLWLPVVLWAAVIFAFSSIPSLHSGLGTWDLVLRKAAHMTEFAILGLLLLRALGRETVAFAAGVAYAVTDEVHQHFVEGRFASPFDVLIDATGVAIGVLAAATMARAAPAGMLGFTPASAEAERALEARFDTGLSADAMRELALVRMLIE